MLTSTNCVKCVAFKAGPIRVVRHGHQLRVVHNLATKRSGTFSLETSSSSTSDSHALGFVETAAAALIASGVIAGSCLAADAPDGAEQVVQAAKRASDVLRPLFNIFTILYIIRVPMTWYPDIDGKKLPWLVAYVPTEPILSVTRKVVPLVSGVDVSPIVWVGLISFLNEILLGPQGILTLIQARGGL
ncbi:hypothetical protein VOLCADRAFT_58408 [Volvox carteri f. nagariensis]|uniref:Uncharacterized protein n=1 Tax=Volvox carteri f. nagariensis TaxID=3068 RepID=D8TQ08_VOLCA|nr:uncharacterized protein VOLCADRAFT_58408 [Volvox carteri f. nagariensis]EFJ50452.1 hypothetical protein VOLCADRAFT_58408 [Volvox carteri f. nagariensis]|eukprot:XP_002948577.1 hypothetical protein VOLCADRAFT_58408 [Volvox carteri f. nagariensis]